MASPGFRMRQSAYGGCTAVIVLLACLGGPAMAGPVGPAETFQGDAVGSFPGGGWNDVALVDPASVAPKPSALVVNTIDAFGHPTKALATLPGIALGRGIYRPIAPSNSYSTSVDVRIDRYSDFDPNASAVDCGCPPGSEPALDWAMSIGFNQSQGATELADTPSMQLLAGARTQTWILFAVTQNVVATIDLGVPATLGTWYGVQLDLDAAAGAVHSRITDVATGSTLLDRVTSLLPFGAWDPAIDGIFNVEGFFGGEVTARVQSGLATIDNIDTPIPEPATIVLLASALALGALVRRRK